MFAGGFITDNPQSVMTMWSKRVALGTRMPKTRKGDFELKKLHFSNRPFYSCGLSTLAFENVNARLRLTLFWYKPTLFSYWDYTRKMLVSINKNNMILHNKSGKVEFCKEGQLYPRFHLQVGNGLSRVRWRRRHVDFCICLSRNIFFPIPPSL